MSYRCADVASLILNDLDVMAEIDNVPTETVAFAALIAIRRFMVDRLGPSVAAGLLDMNRREIVRDWPNAAPGAAGDEANR